MTTEQAPHTNGRVAQGEPYAPREQLARATERRVAPVRIVASMALAIAALFVIRRRLSARQDMR